MEIDLEPDLGETQPMSAGGASSWRPAAVSSATWRTEARELSMRVAEGAAEREANQTHNFEAYEWFRGSGLGTLRVPLEYGGPGGKLRDTIELGYELARGDPNLAQALRSHLAFAEILLDSSVAESERQRWFPRMLDGLLFGTAISERGGTRPKDISTSLSRRDGRLVLNGVKYYSTGARFCDYVSVLALDEDGTPINAIVETDRPGVEMPEDWDAMGQRLTASGTTRLTDVEILPDDFFKTTSNASFATNVGSSWRQLYLSAVTVGIAQNAFEDGVRLAQGRRRAAQHALTDLAREDPFVQNELGAIAARVGAARSVLFSAAETLDLAYEDPDDHSLTVAAAIAVAEAQVFIADAALGAATDLYEAGGASGAAADRNLDRHWRNVRTITLHNPLSYKRKAIGDYYLNDAEPPASGFF